MIDDKIFIETPENVNVLNIIHICHAPHRLIIRILGYIAASTYHFLTNP